MILTAQSLTTCNRTDDNPTTTDLDELAATYRRQSFVLQNENVVGFLAYLRTAEYRRHSQAIGLTLLYTDTCG